MKADSVGIGTRVRVRINDKEKEFCIVPPGKSNAENGCISPDSPIALAILDKKIGDVSTILLPNNIRTNIYILEIHYL